MKEIKIGDLVLFISKANGNKTVTVCTGVKFNVHEFKTLYKSYPHTAESLNVWYYNIDKKFNNFDISRIGSFRTHPEYFLWS